MKALLALILLAGCGSSTLDASNCLPAGQSAVVVSQIKLQGPQECRESFENGTATAPIDQAWDVAGVRGWACEWRAVTYGTTDGLTADLRCLYEVIAIGAQ